MDIQFINTKEWGIDKKAFQKYIKRLQGHVPKADGVLNVVFVNDDYIQSLNKSYRKKDAPTDVLSFSYLKTPDFKDTGLIGEIYISVETARRNVGAPMAKTVNRSGLSSRQRHGASPAGATMEPAVADELSKLFVHGFLHVFGHNHESEKDFKKMNKIEREVLD